MKRNLVSIVIPLSLLLVIICMNISCNNKKKELGNSIFSERSPEVHSNVDFIYLSNLNTNNKKIIELSSKIFQQNKPRIELPLILKIKEDHQNNERDLKQLTKNNLVVIPKTFYKLNLNKDSLEDKEATQYLVKLLKNEISIQIEILENIQNTTSNPDFKSFAEKSEILFKQNNKDLGISFNF